MAAEQGSTMGPEDEQWTVDSANEFLERLLGDEELLNKIANSELGEALLAKLERGQNRLDTETEDFIDSMIEEIRTNPFTPRWKRLNTNYEAALKMFKENDSGVGFEQLKTLVADAEDPGRAAQLMIHNLNKKIEGSGYRIRRLSEYFIVPVDES